MRKKSIQTTLDITDRTGTRVKVPLPKGITGRVTRSRRTGLTSVRLQGYGTLVRLRERTRGSIELRADWIPEVTDHRSDRMSTGTSKWTAAIRKGVEALKVWYDARKDLAGSPGALRLHEAIRLIREHDLFPGDPSTDTGQKARRTYTLVLDLAEAILPEDPTLPLNQRHIETFYRVRAKSDTPPTSSDSLADLVWPDHIDRKPVARVRPRTVQKNLEDLRTALRWLQSAAGLRGIPLLTIDPMVGLDLGDHKPQARGMAGPQRLGLILHSADQATERMREEGLEQRENRRLPDGGSRSVTTHRCLENVVPGMLRGMLVQTWQHAPRPRACRHTLVDGLALTRSGLVDLVRGLDLLGDEWTPPDEVFDLWVYGGIHYPREWSKLEQERLVPLSKEGQAELALYRERRSAWLRAIGAESPWLYPSPRNPSQPISETDARLLLLKGERVAREKLPVDVNPDEFLPHLPGAGWYAFRRRWKHTANELGWERSSAAAYVGDWAYRSGPTADTVYARVSARQVLGVVQGETFTEVTANDNAVEEARQAARVTLIDPATLK